MQQLISKYDVYKNFKVYNLDEYKIDINNLSLIAIETSNYVNDVTKKFIEIIVAH